MLKFRDKNGQLKFIQFDDSSQPIEVDKIAIDILREYGLEEEINSKSKKLNVKTQGISQNDLDILKEKP